LNLPHIKLTRDSSDPGILMVDISGSWDLSNQIPADLGQSLKQLESLAGLTQITLRGAGIEKWDSSLAAPLFRFARISRKKSVNLKCENLPSGLNRLLELASAVPEKQGARRLIEQESLLHQIGAIAVQIAKSLPDALDFIGETSLAFGRLIIGKARLPKGELPLIIERCGPSALPIVTLISLLVGLILAFIGSIQLRQFGAQIYVADLVGIAMTREMGAIMAGIIMAGRTGAAFAAQLGTMQVNEEIDAFKTLGISPIEFLVVPRVLALVLMMPLLCVFADFMGIAGGALVSVSSFEITFIQYFDRTCEAVGVADLWIGVIKSLIFGVLVALAGCFQGIRCSRSASAVGLAVTSAVVTGIVCIIVSDAIFAVICNALGV
jgi:phospholipid/cholesterol/gamma-HCH transport system permease protein